MAIEAISFDLWDTVIHDDSDEPKRAARGLRSKAAERRHLVAQALAAQAPIDARLCDAAYNAMEAAFRHVWHYQHVTWTVAERLQVLLAGLGRELPAETTRCLTRALEEMELEVMPDPIEGVREALEALASRYRLGVMSDAIYTPGRCLRTWLERHDLLRYFEGFAFSDEVGRSKPHRAMFDALSTALRVPHHAMVHVGDREHNDVAGAHAAGLRAILFAGTRDRDLATTRADAVCLRHAELPAVVARLAARDDRVS